MKRVFLLFSILVLSVSTFAQKCNTLGPEATERVMRDVIYLASDEMEGRRPGTEGAERARIYIADNFAEAGLQPVFEGSYFQDFKIAEWVQVDAGKTTLTINGNNVTSKAVYYPIAYSSNTKAEGNTIYVGYGITATELDYDDYKKLNRKKLSGKIFIMDVSSPDGIHPHSKYVKYHNLEERIKNAKKNGAKGVILVNGGTMASDPALKFRKIKSKGIPVVFLKNSPVGTKWKKIKTASISVKMAEQYVTASNVAAFKDNGAKFTVLIGAHYDHLGWGRDNSLYTGEPAIHNGADDNASGTAGLLALARYFAQDTLSIHSNYLFVAFSGEERGLLGSNYFVKNSDYSLDQFNYMLNMDMIGRLEDDELAVSGIGTTPLWENIVNGEFCHFNLKLSESGVGPSDHTSFYNREIPVLHFFTGTHEDYHKPSDDAEKINFKGEMRILNFMINIINDVNGEKLEFTATVNQDSRKAPKFSVTLGIVPDYMYEEGGVKADGVTEGKPASNAGLQPGDIIVQLGEIKVTDIYAYMDALAQFKKGDKTTVVYLRDGKQHKAQLTF